MPPFFAMEHQAMVLNTSFVSCFIYSFICALRLFVHLFTHSTNIHRVLLYSRHCSRH